MRGVLPAWRTFPRPALYRESGLPSAEAALEQAKHRFAMRLQTVDKNHPFVRRIDPPVITRRHHARRPQTLKTKLQRLGHILPRIPRSVVRPPHFTPGCRTDPTGGRTKEEAAADFKTWWTALPPDDITVFSDGSEQYSEDGEKFVGYGYAVYQGGNQITSGHGSINSTSHVFDAEAIGAWKGLQSALRLPDAHLRRIYQCIDSTSVIWCLRSNASSSSQWAFHLCQDAMQVHDIRVKWAPGHTGIEGNEEADRLADLGALDDIWDEGLASEPTVSGIRSIYRSLNKVAINSWWAKHSSTLSSWYQSWKLDYHVKELPELSIPRTALQRLIAIRSNHGDFAWYHRKFKHEDALLECSCGQPKNPLHLVRCRKAKNKFTHWPQKPPIPPSDNKEAREYLRALMTKPLLFLEFLQATEFYSKICPRY